MFVSIFNESYTNDTNEKVVMISKYMYNNCFLFKEEVNQFQVPPCKHCGGIMKPYIVFFGDNVPKDRVERVKQELSESDGLLVLGSSLFVYSGYR